jgi:hypothetical protein
VPEDQCERAFDTTKKKPTTSGIIVNKNGPAFAGPSLVPQEDRVVAN